LTSKGTPEGTRAGTIGYESKIGDPFSTLRLYAEAERRPTNLPIPSTPLINREKEFKTLREMLLRDDVRLVTLTGSGGTGKTRLALEVASTVIKEFPHGAFFVSLVPVTEPNLVPSAIVSTLGIMEKVGKPIEETLKDYLREKRVLLLLDNFEHVIAAASVATVLLLECPRLKILVTSRAPLRVRGEHELPVPPLAVPNLTRMPKAEEVIAYAAVELFVQRAQAIRADFSVTTDNARTVSEICARLDGLPLALELAAARIRVLSPQALLLRLQKRLELLTGGPRDLPARQQTLRSTIRWSYDLLEEEDKIFFRRFSVFAGSFSLEAAEAICATVRTSGEKTLDQLSRLVEKSLLLSETIDGALRFRMLETIREFAFESLTSSGENDQVTQIFADYFISLAERAESELRGPDQGIWLARLEQDHDNLRAALRRSLEDGKTELSLRLCSYLWFFWYIRGYLTEGRVWLERTLAKCGTTVPRLRAKALLGAGTLAAFQYDFPKARSLLSDSLAISRELGDKEGIGRSLNILGIVARNQGDFTEGKELHEECLATFRELGDKWGIATVLNSLGVGARYQTHYDEAIPIHRQSLELFRELGDKRSTARALANLGSLLNRKEDYESAERLLDESLSLYLELGDKIGIADSLYELGGLARRQRGYDTAIKWLNEALLLYEEIGSKDGIDTCFEEFVACACAEEQFERASRLLGAAQAMRETLKSPIPPDYLAEHERNVTTTRLALGEQDFEREKNKGREMTPKEAVEYALGGVQRRVKET
jgi:predicted ATPase